MGTDTKIETGYTRTSVVAHQFSAECHEAPLKGRVRKVLDLVLHNIIPMSHNNRRVAQTKGSQIIDMTENAIEIVTGKEIMTEMIIDENAIIMITEAATTTDPETERTEGGQIEIGRMVDGVELIEVATKKLSR